MRRQQCAAFPISISSQQIVVRNQYLFLPPSVSIFFLEMSAYLLLLIIARGAVELHCVLFFFCFS